MNKQSSYLIPDSLEFALGFNQLLTVSETKKSGLILCKPFHAEFAGPGAAIGTLVEQECVAIIAIGSPEIVEVSTISDRQKAYSRRIQWARWLQKIAEHADPVQRVEKLFSSFEAFFGRQVLVSLSDEALALLIGVLPSTIAMVRSHHHSLEQFDELEFLPVCELVALDRITHKQSLFRSQGEPGLKTIPVSSARVSYNLLRTA